MFRILVSVLVAIALAGSIMWYYDLWDKVLVQIIPPDPVKEKIVDPRAPHAQGGLLYPAAAEPTDAPVPASLLVDPIVIANCHFIPVDVQEVPSQREGQLLFIGAEVQQSNLLKPNLLQETVKIDLGEKEVLRTFLRLKEGDLVQPNQMLALVNPALAIHECESRRAKIVAAKADHKATVKTHEEAIKRYETMLRLGKNAAPEEVRGAELLVDKYALEAVSKFQAITTVQLEATQADLVLLQHEVRNKIPGPALIHKLYKQRGDAVRAGDTVMQLYGLNRMRAEGLAEGQYVDRLKKGMKVTLEPQHDTAPFRVLREHRAEVTSVAVSKDWKIVSGSEDQTVCIWSLDQKQAREVLFHPSAVRAVACTPLTASQNLFATGCADGSLRVFDLDKVKPVWEKGSGAGGHTDAVSALAFSPDGRFLASGGEDNSICMWETATGKLLYRFSREYGVEDTHQGTITALYFTPQTRLVSASRDNTLRVWELHEKGPKPHGAVIKGRGGNVAKLGVSADGRYMLFDKSKSLQLLSVRDGRSAGLLQNTAATFETLALFNSDASLLLTAGAAEGRLQLWTTPSVGSRGFEVRQLATEERSPVTCAAFAPFDPLASSADAKKASFAVSGNKDGQLYIWPVPTRQEIADHPIRDLQVSMVDPGLDAGNRQIRFAVDVQNPISERYPYGRLQPGRVVTVVIEP